MAGLFATEANGHCDFVPGTVQKGPMSKGSERKRKVYSWLTDVNKIDETLSASNKIGNGHILALCLQNGVRWNWTNTIEICWITKSTFWILYLEDDIVRSRQTKTRFGKVWQNHPAQAGIPRQLYSMTFLKFWCCCCYLIGIFFIEYSNIEMH